MKEKEINVLYVGDAYLMTTILSCGFDSITFSNDCADLSHDLMNALSSDCEINATHMSSHAAYRLFPSKIEELTKYDVLILSDIGATSLLFQAPSCYTIGAAPNRLEVIKEFVDIGKGLLMNGGWFTFGGFNGLGRWHGTAVEEVLPVKIHNGDDRIEGGGNTFKFDVVTSDHPIMSGIPWEEMLPILGYNRSTLKDGAVLLAKIGDDPAIAIREYGKGRTMILATDPAPEWAGPEGVSEGYFRNWEYYPKFWGQTVKWLAKRL